LPGHELGKIVIGKVPITLQQERLQDKMKAKFGIKDGREGLPFVFIFLCFPSVYFFFKLVAFFFNF